MQVKFRYGTGNEQTREFPDGTSLGTALADSRLKAGLGYGANVEGWIGSVPQAGTVILREGMSVDIHDKACAKARAQQVR